MDNVESGDEDVRKNLGAIPSAKAVNPHQQQQQQHMHARPHRRQDQLPLRSLRDLRSR